MVQVRQCHAGFYTYLHTSFPEEEAAALPKLSSGLAVLGTNADSLLPGYDELQSSEGQLRESLLLRFAKVPLWSPYGESWSSSDPFPAKEVQRETTTKVVPGHFM